MPPGIDPEYCHNPFAKNINHSGSPSRQTAAYRGTEAAWGAPAAPSAALPHVLWHVTCLAASYCLTGECEVPAIPGAAKQAVLEFSNK